MRRIELEQVVITNIVVMAKLSKDAFAIMAICPEARRPYGITVDNAGIGHYVFHWAFSIDKDKAHREGYDEKSVSGTVSLDDNYPGCPYCGSKNFLFCGNCGSVICYHGQSKVTCPKCGFTGEVTSIENVNLKGGGY